MTTRVIVLKSLRTRSGAEDWARTMSRQYPTAKVMDTDTLKGFSDVAYTVDPVGFSSHVVIEEDLTPVINIIKEGEFGELVKALCDKGYATIDSYGLCLTEKWHEASSAFMAEVVDRGLTTYKSAEDFTLPEEYTNYLRAIAGILKSVGEIPSVPENNETGDEPETPETITDAQVTAATTAKTAPSTPDVADGLDSETVTDAQVGALTTKSVDEEEKDEEEEEETPVGEVFKSLSSARAWDNPDPSRFYVDSMTFEEKKAKGVRYNYIVREKQQKAPIGAFGNKLIR